MLLVFVHYLAFQTEYNILETDSVSVLSYKWKYVRAHKHCTAFSDRDTLGLSDSTEQRPPNLLSED
jgi:hypothetical protein